MKTSLVIYFIDIINRHFAKMEAKQESQRYPC